MGMSEGKPGKTGASCRSTALLGLTGLFVLTFLSVTAAVVIWS